MAVAPAVTAPAVITLKDTRSYNALTRIIANLPSIPGRKAVIFFSDNTPPSITAPLYFADQVLRASTTLYQCVLPGWHDYWSDFSNSTGGCSIKAGDDRFQEMEQLLRDFDCFYLLGYKPDKKTLDNLQEYTGNTPPNQRIVTNEHSLRIRLKKTGLKVRTRSGFSDVSLRNTGLSAGNPRLTSARTILSSSPLVSGNLEIAAESLPFYTPLNKESVIRTVLHIDGTLLYFRPEPEEGYRVAEVSIMGQASLDGRLVNSYRGTGTFRASVKDFRDRIKKGFVSTFDVPVPGPGFYELRSTIIQAGRIGNVSMLVDVPEFAGSDLAASGIATFNIAKEAIPQADAGVPTRKIRRSEPFACSLSVYNARRQDGVAKLDAQLRLYRGGVLIKASDVVPIRGEDSASSEIPVMFTIDPSPELTAGNYLVEVMVIDRLAGKKHGTAAQSVAVELAE